MLDVGGGRKGLINLLFQVFLMFEMPHNEKFAETSFLKDSPLGDFHHGPVAKTPSYQCSRPGFDSWSGNYSPHAATEDPP